MTARQTKVLVTATPMPSIHQLALASASRSSQAQGASVALQATQDGRIVSTTARTLPFLVLGVEPRSGRAWMGNVNAYVRLVMRVHCAKPATLVSFQGSQTIASTTAQW